MSQISHNLKFSEVMPHPSDKDYNSDGIADLNDEYFELHNTGTELINLDGYSATDASGRFINFLPQTR